jgi:hypothetical protein
MTLQTRIIFWFVAIICMAMGVWGIHHSGYAKGYEQRELEYQAAEAAAQREARATEARQAETFTGAINEHNRTTNRNQTDAAGTHAERDRVRTPTVTPPTR